MIMNVCVILIVVIMCHLNKAFLIFFVLVACLANVHIMWPNHDGSESSQGSLFYVPVTYFPFLSALSSVFSVWSALWSNESDISYWKTVSH